MIINYKMLKIYVNGKIIQFDLFHIDFDNWMRIHKYVIKEYGFKLWLEYTYYVRHKDELEEKEYQEACELLMKYV